jgi:hypothetical protein
VRDLSERRRMARAFLTRRETRRHNVPDCSRTRLDSAASILAHGDGGAGSASDVVPPKESGSAQRVRSLISLDVAVAWIRDVVAAQRRH